MQSDVDGKREVSGRVKLRREAKRLSRQRIPFKAGGMSNTGRHRVAYTGVKRYQAHKGSKASDSRES